jgi:hypothetical protein
VGGLPEIYLNVWTKLIEISHTTQIIKYELSLLFFIAEPNIPLNLY